MPFSGGASARRWGVRPALPMKYCSACHKTYPGDYNVCPADQTALQNAHELQSGMIIRNKYQLLDRIGIGGMGVVYRSRHLTFNEVCAIKIVNDVISGDERFLQRFQAEAVITRKLRHPNAVRVDDFDYTEDGRPFIVMELVEGKNIGEILQIEGPFRVSRAVRIATQAARALGAAHKIGVVHRDIKPANIILTTDEDGKEIAKVLDFGIAKLREVAGSDQPGMTMTGMVVGTPLYMSPEQFMGKKAGGEIDGRTDIYSLGVVLYQMVTAQLPFDGDTPYSLMVQHMQGTVRPPHELAPDLHIPESLSRVVLKAIDKSRDQRFQTAEEFIAALEESGLDRSGLDYGHSAALQSGPAPSAETIKAPTSPQVLTPQVAPGTSASQSSKANLRPATSSVNPPLTPRAESSAASENNMVAASPADSSVVNSAAQHVFIQPRKLRVKQLLTLVALLMTAVLVAGVGYLKYQTLRRMRIESAVTEMLKTSPTLGRTDLRVQVSDTREVILDGKVQSKEDSIAAGNLAGSIQGVTGVINRIEYPPVIPNTDPAGTDAKSPASLISDGTKFLDDGKYAEAIACFSKAAALDPNNKQATELLDHAKQAAKTEQELLKNRPLN